jgi:DNA-binding MarR family transcriptional regulator
MNTATQEVLDAVAVVRRVFRRERLDGLDAVRMQVLLALAENRSQMVCDITRRLQTHQSSVSAAIGKLEDEQLIEGHIERGAKPRRRRFSLTASGENRVRTFLL